MAARSTPSSSFERVVNRSSAPSTGRRTGRHRPMAAAASARVSQNDPNAVAPRRPRRYLCTPGRVHASAEPANLIRCFRWERTWPPKSEKSRSRSRRLRARRRSAPRPRNRRALLTSAGPGPRNPRRLLRGAHHVRVLAPSPRAARKGRSSGAPSRAPSGPPTQTSVSSTPIVPDTQWCGRTIGCASHRAPESDGRVRYAAAASARPAPATRIWSFTFRRRPSPKQTFFETKPTGTTTDPPPPKGVPDKPEPCERQ